MESLELDIQLKKAISAEMAWEFRVVPKALSKDLLTLYSEVDFLNDKEQREIEFLLGRKIHFEMLPPSEVSALLAANYGREQESTKQEVLQYSEDFLIRLVQEADQLNSSDIHIEIYEDKARVRMRIDGHLLVRHILDLSDYPALINKVKVQAKLDISEKRRPQDGRIAVDMGSHSIDLRVSLIPTLYGEKAVLRLLQRDASEVTLDKVGLTLIQQRVFKEAIQKPQGIVLISGPTGSGKTTTLYASLKHLNQSERNILTVEDPIEYTLEGINQLQLNEGIGLTFASVLRAFLRQDPDVIMLGEVRDRETAEMAVRASLTGHLVFSTIHTQSAWGTVDRLIDMGVPEFMIASTLNLSVAQRLVRKLCPVCKKAKRTQEVDLPSALSPSVFKTDQLYQAVGCPNCYLTGYRGRTALFELIPVSDSVRSIIRDKGVPSKEMFKSFGFSSLQEQAISLVTAGVTSIEEAYGILSVNSF